MLKPPKKIMDCANGWSLAQGGSVSQSFPIPSNITIIELIAGTDTQLFN